MACDISIGVAELGYCHFCLSPALVVQVGFPFWRHKALICDPCAQRFAKEVRNMTTVPAALALLSEPRVGAS